MVHGWYEQGLTDRVIAQNSYEIGLSLSVGAIGRHRGKHMRPHIEYSDTPSVGAPMEDLEALDKILDVGSRQIDNWKITPSDWFKALEAKYKLTQGSAFQSTLDALNVAGLAEEEDESSPEGSVDADEQGQVVLRTPYAQQRPTPGSEDVADELDRAD